MAENSKIEWTNHTFNPWIGCTKVGPGCDHCYAEALMDTRYGRVNWGPGNPRSRTSEANWRKPLAWNKRCEKLGIRERVFCASLADVFDNEVPNEWRQDLWSLIRATPRLDWLLLTKRIGNALTMLPMERFDNVWIGVTVVNQEEADRDIPKLLVLNVPVRFLSIEPLLGPIDLRYLQPGDPPTEINALEGTHGVLRPHRGQCERIDWVIVGGESGPAARPMHPDWPRSIRDQCVAAGVPFLFKQHGEHVGIKEMSVQIKGSDPMTEIGEEWVWKVGKARAGRMLDGQTWDQVPEGVR